MCFTKVGFGSKSFVSEHRWHNEVGQRCWLNMFFVPVVGELSNCNIKLFSIVTKSTKLSSGETLLVFINSFSTSNVPFKNLRQIITVPSCEVRHFTEDNITVTTSQKQKLRLKIMNDFEFYYHLDVLLFAYVKASSSFESFLFVNEKVTYSQAIFC